jgi:hypothetical protein
MLPIFVEYAYLCGTKYSVQQSVCLTFDREDLLTHTGVIMIENETQGAPLTATIREFVLSNCDRPWGLQLPACPVCNRSIDVLANFGDNDQCSLRCKRCRSTTRSISRPEFVTPCTMAHLRQNKYFTIPFRASECLVVDRGSWVVKQSVSSKSQ